VRRTKVGRYPEPFTEQVAELEELMMSRLSRTFGYQRPDSPAPNISAVV
jgi:hypothetical protein